MPTPGTLTFFCGKMAAGKSTLANRIVARTGAILLVEDDWLAHLFPDEVVDVPAFRKYSARLRADAPHELHFIDAPDALCKTQLRARSSGLADGSAWTWDAEFEAITKFFEAPTTEEGFNIVGHQRKVAGDG